MGRHWSTIAHTQTQKTERETPTSSGVRLAPSSLHRHIIQAVYFLPAGFLGTQQVSSLEGFTTGTGTGAASASTQKIPPIVDLLERDSTSNFLVVGKISGLVRVRVRVRVQVVEISGGSDRIGSNVETEKQSVFVLPVS
jgi:hypothetical protein